MQPALALLALSAAVIFVSGLVIMIVGLLRSPEGYEDETGFHYAREKGVPMAVPDPKPEAHAGPLGLAA